MQLRAQPRFTQGLDVRAGASVGQSNILGEMSSSSSSGLRDLTEPQVGPAKAASRTSSGSCDPNARDAPHDVHESAWRRWASESASREFRSAPGDTSHATSTSGAENTVRSNWKVVPAVNW